MAKKKKIVVAWLSDCGCQKPCYVVPASEHCVVSQAYSQHNRYCLLYLLASFDRDYALEWADEVTQDEADATLQSLLAQQDWARRF